jgi:hypothetical protein
MTKEAVEDYKRHKQDNEQNRTPIERFNGECMENKEWRDLVCGDVVRVVRDAFFPCDLIMIGSSNEERTCYVETKNLDGETNLKLKRSVDMGDGVKVISNAKLANLCRNSQRDDVMANAEDHLSGNLCTVECEHPNNSLYTFSGNLVETAFCVGKKENSRDADERFVERVAVKKHGIRLRYCHLHRTRFKSYDERVGNAIETVARGETDGLCRFRYAHFVALHVHDFRNLLFLVGEKRKSKALVLGYCEFGRTLRRE